MEGNNFTVVMNYQSLRYINKLKSHTRVFLTTYIFHRQKVLPSPISEFWRFLEVVFWNKRFIKKVAFLMLPTKKIQVSR